MKTRLLLLALTLASPALAEQSPEAFAKGLYAQYRESGKGVSWNGKLGARTFHPSLVALFRRDQEAARGEVGALGGDPICNCQDYDITAVEPSALPERDGVVPVKVRFKNFGKPDEVELRLKRMAGGWRVYDVSTSDTPSLRAMIEAYLKNPP